MHSEIDNNYLIDLDEIIQSGLQRIGIAVHLQRLHLIHLAIRSV